MSTSANVDLCVPNNAYWQDAFQFGVEDDTTWDFNAKSFIMEIKANRDAAVALFELTSVAGRIVVDNTALRILHFFVSDDDIRDDLPPGTYVYDLIMVDDGNSARTRLMYGEVTITQGVTLTD